MSEGVYIRTYGCQMNEHDSRKLLRILDGNFHPVAEPDGAGLILINTCSVREKPEQKLFSLLGELRPLKQRNPRLLIGVGGCVAQRAGEEIIERDSVVDFVFGTHNLSLVPSLVEARRRGLPPQVAVDYRDGWEDIPLGMNADSGAAALIAISRGCNKNCSFCIVPKTRGPEVSRDSTEILREVGLAVRRGAREVLLLGQTVNSYGRDLNPKMTFVELLRKVSQIDGLYRIRFVSPHPQEVRADLLDLMADDPKICRHIHLPLQSGSDRVLKLMNRNYRRQRFLKIVEQLKQRLPDMAITTDIIVGFPGETEEDFRETLELMEQVQFEGSFSFIFSPRPDTPAEKMPDPVPHAVKLQWLHELQSLQEKHTATRLAAWVGKRVEVLIDGPSKGDREDIQGRTSQNFVVNVRPPTEGCWRAGNLLAVEISKVARFTLRGRLLETGVEQATRI